MARSNEPIVWALFGAGGMVAALFGPILIFLLGIAASMGLLGAAEMFSYAHMRDLVAHPLVRIVLFGIISLPMWHWAHRFRYILVDLGLRSIRLLVAVACYGTALALTAAAALVLWQL